MKILSAEEFRENYDLSKIRTDGDIMIVIMKDYAKYLLEKQTENVLQKKYRVFGSGVVTLENINKASTEFINELNETK